MESIEKQTLDVLCDTQDALAKMFLAITMGQLAFSGPAAQQVFSDLAAASDKASQVIEAQNATIPY